MQQKKLGNILYVFDVNPYEITQDTDAEIIKVQEESYNGFLEMNQSLAEKIVKYNYHVICVNTPEWAPYVEQEDPQEQLTFGIYGAGAADAINQIQVQNENNEVLYHWDAPDIQFPFQCNVEEGQHCAVECKEGVDLLDFNVTGMEYLPIAWTDQETGHYWYATYPITESISIGVNIPSPAEITVITNPFVDIYDSFEDRFVEQTIHYEGYGEGTLVVGRTYQVDQRSGDAHGKVVIFNPECGTGQQGEFGTEFIAPETDLTITLEEPSTHTVVIDSQVGFESYEEQTPDHQTVVQTVSNPLPQETMTVNDGNILAVNFGNAASYLDFDITPNGFFVGNWQDPVTGNNIAWSDPITDDVNVTIATPQPASPELSWELNGQQASGAYVTIGDPNNEFPTLVNPHSVNVEYESTDQSVATIDTSTGAITLVGEGHTNIYGKFYGDSTYAEQYVTYMLYVQAAQPSTYTVTLDGGDIHGHVTVKMDNETVQTEYQYQNVADGTVVDIYPTGNVADYDLQGGAVWDTDHWTATVNGADLTITINYDNRAASELAWSADNATVTIDDPSNVFPTLTNPNSLTVTYIASNPEYASIDQSTGAITLVAAGDTWIEAQFAGDTTYKPSYVTYLLTVQAAQ